MLGHVQRLDIDRLQVFTISHELFINQFAFQYNSILMNDYIYNNTYNAYSAVCKTF
jgi:hypothetical protein